MADREKDDLFVAEFRRRAAGAAGADTVFGHVAEAVVRELDRLTRSRDSCQRWYAERWERLRKLIHDDARHIEDEACYVMANGTADVNETPTYAQLLSRKEVEIGRLTLENDRLRNLVESLTARVAAQAELLGRKAERGEL